MAKKGTKVLLSSRYPTLVLKNGVQRKQEKFGFSKV
jgi:hypothetical protein